jgi:hypothetical protein
MFPKDFTAVHHRARLLYDWRDNGRLERINIELLLEAHEADTREASSSADVIDS